MADRDERFLPRARKAVRGIEKLKWAFYIVIIAGSLTVRFRPLATAIGAGVCFLVLFFIYAYYISRMDCPYCEKSLRYLWPVLKNVTTCPYCGKKLK